MGQSQLEAVGNEMTQCRDSNEDAQGSLLFKSTSSHVKHGFLR
jgi:hypothetical protein